MQALWLCWMPGQQLIFLYSAEGENRTLTFGWFQNKIPWVSQCQILFLFTTTANSHHKQSKVQSPLRISATVTLGRKPLCGTVIWPNGSGRENKKSTAKVCKIILREHKNILQRTTKVLLKNLLPWPFNPFHNQAWKQLVWGFYSPRKTIWTRGRLLWRWECGKLLVMWLSTDVAKL